MQKEEILSKVMLLKPTRIRMSRPEQKKALCAVLYDVIERGIPGSVVELGCNYGSSSVFLQHLMDLVGCDKQYYVYDSFEGVPEKTEEDGNDDRYHGGCMRTTREELEKNFKDRNLRVPIITCGWFINIPDEKYPDPIAFGFLDGDWYQSIVDSFTKVAHKVSVGGVLAIHDYADRKSFPGVEKACTEYFSVWQNWHTWQKAGMLFAMRQCF